MAIIKAFSGALGGTFADLWKDIITAGPFDEHTVVSPGVPQGTNNGRGSNEYGSEGVITNGSRIYVPENTAAFIFSQSGIENVIVEPGGYEYTNGEKSVLAGDGIGSFFDQMAERFTFGGQPAVTKYVAFVNLREIRGVKFGTPSPLVYHDRFYDIDLEIRARGSMSLRVTDAVRFVRNFVPANTSSYSFDDPGARRQLLSEFVQSFIVAVNSLSDRYRISQLPAQANAIADTVRSDPSNAGAWGARFGFEVAGVGIESIEFTDASRELVNRFSSNRMDVAAYEGVSHQAGDMAAQQRIAQGIGDHGFGDGGMLLGMNMAQSINPLTGAPLQPPAATPAPVPTPTPAPAQPVAASTEGAGSGASGAASSGMSVAEQIDALKKLKELLDVGILSSEEFEAKKKEILGL
ncbi:virion core protein [Bifidobacterium rousetti]|uniref:SPFH domain-containing protein n=1 Tax=Bifidobacterium rousetti TaxID=2045439 RepID=UPI000D140911|nr:SPFH domain-containing protein [Bifidobacterium rousetti]KAA8820439.1 virion core protein [Bifidobacterium rousetti]PST49733.1 virion core protein [Bifidobacterium callitrichos]